MRYQDPRRERKLSRWVSGTVYAGRIKALQPPAVLDGGRSPQPIKAQNYRLNFAPCKIHQLALSLPRSLVYGNTGTHGGGDADFLDEDTFGGRRLGLFQGNQQ